MHTIRFAGVYILIFIYFTDSLAVNPGLKLRVTQKGLNYAATTALNSLKLVGETIPDTHGSSDVSVGKVDYDLTGMRITSFVTPQSSISVRSGTGIDWSVSHCSAQLEGNWHYQYRLGFIKVSDHGSFTISVENAGIGVDITLGKDGNGRPTISSTGCTSSIDSVKVKLHGGASWLYQLFDDAIERSIKGQLKDALCDMAKNAINKDANAALAKVKVISPIQNTGTLDYRLLVPPIFGTGYIDTCLKGEIYMTGSQKEAPFTPAPFPESYSSSKMLYIWASDYVLNTAGWALQQENILQYFLTPADLNPKDRDLLNTTCPNNVCIGNFIIKLQDDFPDCTISLNISTVKSPTLNITPTNIQGHFEGNAHFYINFPNKTSIYAFTTLLRANVFLSLKLINQKITANVTQIPINITVTDSNIGNISGPALTWTFQHIVNPKFVIPQFNKIGADGLSLPSSDQISYVNPAIELLQNAIVISSDLNWTPDALVKKTKTQMKSKSRNNSLFFKPGEMLQNHI